MNFDAVSFVSGISIGIDICILIITCCRLYELYRQYHPSKKERIKALEKENAELKSKLEEKNNDLHSKV